MNHFKENTDKKLLIIAFYFPPVLTGGVFRPLKFVKYLNNFGWEPIVLSASKLPFVDYDPDLLNEIPKNVMLHSVPFFSFSLLIKKIKQSFSILSKTTQVKPDLNSVRKKYHRGNTFNNIFSWIKKRLVKLGYNIMFLFIPDQQILWLPLALLKAFLLIKRYRISIILTTSPPNSSHLLGLILKKITGIKWVVDFRDPWFSHWIALDKDAFFYSSRYKTEKWLEKIVVRSADQIITVSEGDRFSLQQMFPKISKNKFYVITNGYDQEDFASLDTQPILNSKFVVSHLGYLYQQTADDFFDAVESLLVENDELRKNMEIRFIGHIDESYKKRINKSNFYNNFRLVGQLKHIDGLQNIIHSDVLLVLLGGNLFDKGEIPGKIFEYMASNKVILAITPKDGDTAKILIESGLGMIVEPGDSESIKQILNQLYHEKVENGQTKKLNKDFLRRFERRNLAKELTYLLDEVSLRHQKGFER